MKNLFIFLRKIKFKTGSNFAGIVHLIMRSYYSKFNSNILTQQALNLKLTGLAEYTPNTQILNILTNNRDLISNCFSKAIKVSENPPAHHYSLCNEEFNVLEPLITEKIRKDLKSVFGLEFVCVYAYITEYFSHSGSFDSSHIWHSDGYTSQALHHKLFYYLSYTDESNGAFEWHTLEFSKLLRRHGFKDLYPDRLSQNNTVLKLLNLKEAIVQSGFIGSAFLFNPSILIHKAGTRLERGRRALVFELMPYKSSIKTKKVSFNNLRALSEIRSAVEHWLT